MKGADIHTVAQLLGHKDLRMAARYQHLSGWSRERRRFAPGARKRPGPNSSADSPCCRPIRGHGRSGNKRDGGCLTAWHCSCSIVPRLRVSCALAVDGPDWVRGRAHGELGKLADLDGHRAEALEEYRRVVRLCRAGNDRLCSDDASRLIRTPYR
jgi:hypothetical protein